MIGGLVVALLPTHFSVAQNYNSLTSSDLINRILEFIMPSQDVRIYAVTEPNKYTIHFDGNWSSSWSMTSMEMIEYDQEVNLIKNKFVKNGYTFKWWSSSTTWAVEYLDQSNVKNLTEEDWGEVTLYAQRIEWTWTVEVYYSVNYYQENADDTWYTLSYTENLTWIVWERANIEIKEYSGFVLSWNAADYQQQIWWDWVEINIYYNRDIYFAYLKLPNWETIALFTGKYGSKVELPETIKQYDEIIGWTPPIPATMPIWWFSSIAQLKTSWHSAWWGWKKHTKTEIIDNQSHYSAIGDDSPNTELKEAYDFAYKYWITTQTPMENADLEWPLTRIEMAKMLSYFAMNVLGMKPDETRFNTFADVSKGLDAAYDNGVTLAYQLWIMWINMPNNRFRPFDLVPRAEFATALSRLLYNTEDWEYRKTDKYYTHHFEKLKEKNIMIVMAPNMQEIRWYVMIMLLRSWKAKENDKDNLIKQYLYNVVYWNNLWLLNLW